MQRSKKCLTASSADGAGKTPRDERFWGLSGMLNLNGKLEAVDKTGKFATETVDLTGELFVFGLSEAELNALVTGNGMLNDGLVFKGNKLIPVGNS